MKKRKFLLPLAFLAGAVCSVDSQANNIEITPNKLDNHDQETKGTTEPEVLNFTDKSALKFTLKKNENGVMQAWHSSHSSHASHSSHRSHSSGY